MEKVIELNGRIDTNNANKIEEEINSKIENFNGDLILDAKNLEYISSAGLRIIMRLKKKNDSTKVTNCNLEIYEIFHMTGFTQMMEITRSLREVSVDGCEIIGTGFYGNVYRINPETIVKVYKEGVSIDMVKNEIELARKAFVMGIPTAIPYDIVKVGDLFGSVFELINASSLQELIINGEDIDALIKQTVDVLKLIHSTKVEIGQLPSKREEIIERAKYCSKFLPKQTSDKLLKLIEDLPETNTMLHGDYHIKNIMRQNGEIILVDMNTISVGHPIFELGAMYATYIGFSSVDKTNAQKFLGISYEQSEKILELIFKYYFENKTDKFIKNVMEKAKIISYLQILFIRIKYKDDKNEIHKQDIEFSKQYLIENVSKMDSLEF